MSTTTPYGIPVARLADLAAVHPDTARRWKRQQHIPRPYDWIIAIRDQCDLGALAPAWSGWVLRNDLLVSPEGASVSPGQVRAIPLQLQLIRALELERLTPRQLELLER